MWEDESNVFSYVRSTTSPQDIGWWVMGMDPKNLSYEEVEEMIEAWCLVWTAMATKDGAIIFLIVL